MTDRKKYWICVGLGIGFLMLSFFLSSAGLGFGGLALSISFLLAMQVGRYDERIQIRKSHSTPPVRRGT